MSPVILSLVIAAIVGAGFLAIFAILLIAMRTEGPYLSPSSAPHTHTERTARRLVGLYVRRELEETPVRSTLGGDIDDTKSPDQSRRTPLRMRSPDRERLARMP
jgi:hypothetical protein